MTNKISRRKFVSLVGMGLVVPMASSLGAEIAAASYRIRTITAGVHFQDTFNLDLAKAAVDFLKRSRDAFVAKGYEVQTLRIATQPLQEYLIVFKCLRHRFRCCSTSR